MIYPVSVSLSLDVMQGDGDQERLKRQQELTALNLYQLQQLQYQYLLRYASDTVVVLPHFWFNAKDTDQTLNYVF